MLDCWGDLHGEDDDAFTVAGNTGGLSDTEMDYGPYTGLPRMSMIPVKIRVT